MPTPSLLFNAMLQPFAPMAVASFLWWQGESNAHSVANAQEYACNQKSMIHDLRTKFEAPTLPFVFVQSFPLFGTLSQFAPFPGLLPGPYSSLLGLSTLRLSQADALSLSGVGMACTIDLGDAGCPFTWQHNRAKRPCAHRAALAARKLVYQEQLVYRGPEPRSLRILDTSGRYKELVIVFDMYGSTGFHRAPVPISVLSFEVLFADSAMNASFWIPATLLPARPALLRSWVAFSSSLLNSNDILCMMLNRQRELTLRRSTAAPTASSSPYC